MCVCVTRYTSTLVSYLCTDCVGGTGWGQCSGVWGVLERGGGMGVWEKVDDASQLENLHHGGASPCFVVFVNRLFPCCRALKPLWRDLQACVAPSVRLLRVDLARHPHLAWLSPSAGLGSEDVVVVPTVIAAHTTPPRRLCGGTRRQIRAFVVGGEEDKAEGTSHQEDRERGGDWGMRK